MIIHPFAPVFDCNSEILILGSFPSVRSRENMFYYGHPQNRFWKVLAAVYDSAVPSTVDEKTAFMLDRKIALWDVIKSCDIEGSADSRIRNAVPNDIGMILERSGIKRIYTNGNKADELFRRYMSASCGIEAVKLPSTSPANAGYSFKRLCDEWRVILDG